MPKKPEIDFENVITNKDLVAVGVELQRRYPELELGILTVMSRYTETQRGPNDIDNAVNSLRGLVLEVAGLIDETGEIMQPQNSLLVPTTRRRLEARGNLPTHTTDISKAARPDYGFIGQLFNR